MNSLSNLSGLYSPSSLYQWFSKDKPFDSIKQLSDHQLLNLANDINAIFSETDLHDYNSDLALPQLVVVGTQSSGKSSVLNSIITMDILPTGKNMVTRTPLDLQLFKLDSAKHTQGWIEFGHLSSHGWTCEANIPITTPTPSDDEISTIRQWIQKKTCQLAGQGMNICSTPITLKIFSPFVPNLSLIDLPGLTMVACTDKGQPPDIKDKIEQLVTSYIKRQRVIILVVMQARPDLETDLGLALIKKFDSSDSRLGQQCLGILTKPDLMNYETHIGDYLTNHVSNNLLLSCGYYVVRNRSNNEMNNHDIFQGFDIERDYFHSHYEYSKDLYKHRTGIHNLTSSLCNLLVSSLSDSLPSVITEIIALNSKISKKLEALGSPPPQSKEAQLAILNRYVSNFYYRFLDSLESRNTCLSFNSAKIIKDSFISFRSDILNIFPFRNTISYHDDYFNHIISSFEGNHMSFFTSPIQILEACMTDEQLRPIMLLKDRSFACIDHVCDTIILLAQSLAKHEQFAHFPPLASQIVDLVVNDILSDLKISAKDQVLHLLSHEESYIWTDNDQFLKYLSSNATDKSPSDINYIKDLLESYFLTVKTNTDTN